MPVIDSRSQPALPVNQPMTELSSETRDQLKSISTATLMSCLYKRGLRNQFCSRSPAPNGSMPTMVAPIWNYSSGGRR